MNLVHKQFLGEKWTFWIQMTSTKDMSINKFTKYVEDTNLGSKKLKVVHIIVIGNSFFY